MSLQVKEIKEFFDEKFVDRGHLLNEIDELHLKKQDRQKEYDNLIKAKWILTEVQKQTQVKFKEKVEGLVTKAIQSVFDRPFEFILDFERVRNKMECIPRLKEGDVIYDNIKDVQGGGLCDIISFAFRVVLWHLKSPRLRNTILLDEPFRFLGDYTAKAGQMLKEVSHKLGVQIIMITHEDELAEIADTSYRVVHTGKQSKVVKYDGVQNKPSRRRVRNG